MQKGGIESSWFKDKAMARGVGTPGLVATSALVALACSVGPVLVKGALREHMRKGKGPREFDIWGREWLK